MSLPLMAAVYLKLIKCPRCGKPIEQTDNYEADIAEISQIGSSPIHFVRSEEVTLVCGSCGHKERTSDWRKFVKS